MTPTQIAASNAPDLPGSLDGDHACADHDGADHVGADLTQQSPYAGGSWLQRRVAGAILFYQRAREGKPSPCRFFPSCSAYALEAVEVHGSWRGGWLSVRRLLRCRPLGPSGFDPVPELRSTQSLDSSDSITSTSPSTSPTTPVQKGG